MAQHKQKIVSFKGNDYRIDEEIAPLLLNMWKLEIKTQCSCQSITRKMFGEDVENVWLLFDTTPDIQKFYNYVGEYVKYEATWNKKRRDEAENTIYRNMLGWGKDYWDLTFNTDNRGVAGKFMRQTIKGKRQGHECWVEDHCDKNDFIMQPHLFFPVKHLEYVEKRIELAVLKLKKK